MFDTSRPGFTINFSHVQRKKVADKSDRVNVKGPMTTWLVKSLFDPSSK